MQKPTIERILGSKVKLMFTVTPGEAEPYLNDAVKHLGEEKPVPGFRPGKAPYAEVAKAHGEMRIWEHALEHIVRAWYMRTVLDEDLDTVGSPEIQIDKLTPKQDIQFTIIAPVAPKVDGFPDYSMPRVDYMVRAVTDAEVDRAVNDLRMMQRKEIRSTEPATKESLVTIDLEMKRDHVILEGGTSRDYRIYLSETHYIPGFNDKLIGIKEGEERTFTLAFPAEHYQKHLAGKDVEFVVKAKQIFNLELPKLDDDFAKSLGQANLEGLRVLIRDNIAREEEAKAKERCEIQLLEKLVDDTTFSEVPELLINQEVRKMLHELEHSVEERGMKFDEYLSSLKKSKDELRLDFAPQAVRRVKTAVLIKEIAKKEQIAVTEDELDKEIDRILSGLDKDDRDARERVSSPEYREYVAVMLRNHKTIDFLKHKGVSGYPEHTHDENEAAS